MQNVEQSSEQVDFEQENALLQSISIPKESHPTKNKVNTFKTRVFRLLRIYAQKSKDINPLLKCITQDIFYREPEKINQIVLVLLNRKNLTKEALNEFAEIYKNMILYKEKKKIKNITYADTFIKLLKLLHPAQSISIVKDMIQQFTYKRKCNLKLDFFYFLVRKIHGFKKPLLQACGQLLQKNIRPAQKRQLEILKTRLERKSKDSVKEENIQEQ